MRHSVDPDYLNAVSELMRDSSSFLNGLNLIPRQSSPTDSILLALISKSIVLVNAIVVLVANDFADEAFGLCRTCIEIELTVRYLTNKDTVERCSRYFYYFSKDKTEWFRLIQKYFPEVNQQRRHDQDWIEKLATSYKSPHKWHNCPNGLKDFSSEIDEHETNEDGSHLDELFYYEVLYKWMSHYVHVTVPSLDPLHITAPGEEFRIHPGAGQSKRGDDAVRTSFLNVQLNTSRVLRYFNMDFPDSLKSKFDNVVTEHVSKEGR
jgi:hypothetical protein